MAVKSIAKCDGTIANVVCVIAVNTARESFDLESNVEAKYVTSMPQIIVVGCWLFYSTLPNQFELCAVSFANRPAD